MATTLSLCAPNRVSCSRLGGKRAVGSTRALAATRAPARFASRRSVTTRAVQEIAGSDWKKEVLEVRPSSGRTCATRRGRTVPRRTRGLP